MDTANTRENEETAKEVATPIKAVEAAPHQDAPQHAPPAGQKMGEWWKDKGFTRSLEIIIMVATVVNAGVAWVQWESMERANKEAERSADAAVTAVAESKRQFNLQRQDASAIAKEERARIATERVESEKRAAASLEEAKRLNRLTESQIAQARRQTEIAARASEENSAQAKANREFSEAQARTSRELAEAQAKKAVELEERALQASERAFRFGMRARIKSVQFSGMITPDLKAIRAFVTVKNSGNSDAMVAVGGNIIVSSYIDQVMAYARLPYVDPLSADCASLFQETIMRDQPVKLFKEYPVVSGESATLHLTAGTFTPEQSTDIKSGYVTAYVVGCIRSRDEFGEVQHTQICASVDEIYPQKARMPKMAWKECDNNNMLVESGRPAVP